MEVKQITAARKIVQEELETLCTELGIAPSFVVGVVQGRGDGDGVWVGVEVRTDGDLYEAFYDDWVNPYALESQEAIATKIDEALGGETGRYFEKYGGGVIYIF